MHARDYELHASYKATHKNHKKHAERHVNAIEAVNESVALHADKAIRSCMRRHAC